MKGNCHPEAAPPSQLPLTRSTSDATTPLASVDCDDILRPLENGIGDDGSEWTDEKHNSYLCHLEESFVKQLHQLKTKLSRCSGQTQGDMNISQTQLINANKAYEQFDALQNGCRQKIYYARCEPLSCSLSLNSNPARTSKGIRNISYMSMCGSPPSTDMPEFRRLSHVMKDGKRTTSSGSNENFPGKPSHECSPDFATEGMGQNFLDENNQTSSNLESPAKRLRMVSADASIQDKIAP